MKRTTIFLEAQLLRRAQQMARREGKSFAAIVREAVSAYVAGSTRPATRLPSVAGQFASGHSDVSQRVDDFLWEEPHR